MEESNPPKRRRGRPSKQNNTQQLTPRTNNGENYIFSKIIF
jgi:hypothetical protein